MAAVQGEPLLEVHGLGKRYPVLSHRGDRLAALWDLLRGRVPRRQVDVLQAIDFSVYAGESLAIIGENGAGKSTLLKLITGVLTPSDGQVVTRGSVGALLELGAGFHPELSGRDNVRMTAALYGMSDATLAEKLPEIEAFAGIGEYIDEPVKHYSTGMVVRLGFAIIAAVRPRLLITDEVLAVGDESFQKKCIHWLDDYLASGGTLLLVSHSLYHVQKLCRRALWLHQGRIEALGDVFEVSQRYLAWHESQQGESALVTEAAKTLQVAHWQVNGQPGDSQQRLRMGDDLVIDVVLQENQPDLTHGSRPVFLCGLVRADGAAVYGVSSEMDAVAAESVSPGCHSFRLRFPALPLLPGEYRLRAHAMDADGLRLVDTRESTLVVVGDAREFGMVRLAHRWERPE